MDEQRAWIKSRRKRRLRILAAALSFCLLVTTYPDILAVLSALAAGTQDGDGTVYVAGFAELPEEVREQTVPLGTGMEELTLPDTLEAFVTITEGEDALGEKTDAPDKEKNPDDDDPKEDNTVSGAGTGNAGTGTETGGNDGAGTDTEKTEEDGADNGNNTDTESGSSTENGEAGTGGAGTDTETDGSIGTGSAETGTETGDSTGIGDNTDTENGGTGTENTVGGSTENGSSTVGDENGTDAGTSTDGSIETSPGENGGADTEQETPPETGSTADEISAEETGNADNTEAQQQSAPEQPEGESAPQAQTEPALEESQETHTVTMPEYQSGQTLTIETLEASAAGESGSANTDADDNAAGSAGSAAAASGSTDAAPQTGGSGSFTGSASAAASTDGASAAASTDDPAAADSMDEAPAAANSTYTALQGSQPEQTEQTEQSEQPEQTEQAAIGGITWESDPAYDAETEGVYIFTPVLPEGYALAEGVSLPEITVTVMGDSEQAKALDALLALLRGLPGPEGYLTYDEAADVVTEHEEMIDEEQLARAREAADAYLEAYPDTDRDVTSGADIAGGAAAAINEASGEDEDTDEDTATLASLLTRLEGLEHIRDTVTDCMEADCPYHYPQFVKARMAENEIPELLTLEDLVEDYGIEEPEPAPVRRALSRAGYAAAPRAVTPSLHPQTLMITTDNENNAHTGTPDNDIDRSMTLDDGNHPVEISFTLNELPVQSAYLAVKAYDVDEESGEHDFVYFNDDIYKPMDKEYISNVLFGDKTKYNESNIGYLSGTDETWNVTVLKVPLEKLVKGKNVISITVANSWCVDIDWMQLVLDGGAVDPAIESFSLKLSDVENSVGKVTLHADVTVKQSGSTEYVTEYTLTKEATGDALDACFGKAQTKESISFTMDKGLETGTYKITGLLKDPTTEEIKAMDSVSFYFISGEGVGPKVSHTLTPDTLTKGNVTIRVQAETMPSVTNVTVPSPVRTVTKNGRYGFTVKYQINGQQKSFTYYVPVNNIDRIPPSISYTPVTIPEDLSQTEAAEIFKAALSAWDDRKLADNPFTWTLPANTSYLPGTKNITVTAADAAGNTAAKTCAVTVTAKPLQLTMGTPTAVSGSKDSFALKAVLTHTGADTITKTGFVWGVMPNPTLEVKNGSVATASPVKTKDAALSGTATGIASGVQYYARAYATLQNGSTVYSDSVPFGSGLPDYGTFSVSKVSGSTFTISRTGGTDGKQTVYYRTVNGSAIGGTHFTHAAGSLIFADGETSKTVTVSEKGVTTAYSGRAATSYSNADRTYSLEIYRVEGGGKLDSDKANLSKTRTMTKNNSYTVRRTLYTGENERSVAVNDNNKWVADNDTYYWRKVVFINDRGKNAAQGNKNFNVQRTMDLGTAGEQAYIKATAEGFFYKLQLGMTETDNGYEHVWISNHAPNSMRGPENDNHTDYESIPLDFSAFGHAFYTGRWEAAYQNVGSATASFPSENGLTPGKWHENILRYRDNSRINGEWIIYNMDETAHVWFAANGNKKNMWYVTSYKDWVKIRDTKEPQLVGVAPMAGGTYLPGDRITVALVFDEIVDSGYSSLGNVSINTNVGTLTYAGGADTNVLYFTGTVASGSSLSGSSALQVTGINNSGNIKDMCDGGSAASSYKGSTNVAVDASKPDVTITAQTSGSLPRHTAKITSSENTVRYAWTKDTNLPAAGWQTLDGTKSGQTLTETRGAAGQSEIWYLHVLATASSGAVTHAYQAFTFMQPDITAISVREGAAPSSADVSDVWKTYKYIVAQYAGAQTSGAKITLGGPQTGTQNISAQTGAAAFRVTKNGAYTLTLTDSYNNVVTKTIEVKKIDTELPTATLQSGSQTGNGVTHNSVSAVITPSDTGGSGVAKVEYAWTNGTSTPSGWAVLNKAADGSYQTTYNATETTKTAKYLHVRVTDGAGNVSQIQRSGPYYVIKAAAGNALPSINVTESPSGWARSKTLTWTAKAGTGTGAGTIKSVTVPTGDKPATGTSGSCEVTENGNYRFTVTDSNGNTVSTQVTVATIDNEAPELTKVTAAGGKTAKITLTGVTDALTRVLDEKGNFTRMSGSGVAKREYQYENESVWYTFSGDSFAPDKNGTYKIRLTDSVGNVSETYSVTLSNLDKTAPKVTCTIKATANANGWYTVYPLPVELTYEDPAGAEGGAGGIASVQYKWVNDKSSYPAAGLSSLSAAAVAGGKYTVNLGYYDNAEAYYLYYKVTDKTGNITQGYSDLIKKDSYKGSASVTGPDKGQPATSGLLMKLNSLTYGPSGGKVTRGTWEETGLDTATPPFLIPTHAAGQKTHSSTQNYTAKTPGSNYFRFYPTAADGGSYYWAFYVRKVAFDSQGGSAVEPQLVWHDSTNAVKCTVTEPTNPTRTGYKFDGWYTDAACTAGKKFNFDTQLRADTTLYAKWTAETYKVTYHITQPTSTTEYPIDASYKTYTYGKGRTLPVPTTTRSGFIFDGWYEKADYTGTAFQSIGETAYGNKEYYGRFKDVQAPTVEIKSVTAGKGTEEWYNNGRGAEQSYIILSVNDNRNTNESDLFMKWDDGEFISLGKCKNASIVGSAVRMLVRQSGSSGYVSGSWPEGEHTLTFKVVDAAGNEGFSTSVFKWDASRPEIGKIDYGTVGTFTDGGITYLCGNEEVVLSVPVSDSVSGVNTLNWMEKEKGTTVGKNKEIALSGEKEETAKLRFGLGSQAEVYYFYCRDKAINSPYVADFATIEADGTTYNTHDKWTGIIVEDTPPDIELRAADGSGSLSEEVWYDTCPGVMVRVNDTGATGDTQGTAISSGIKDITYSINGSKLWQMKNAKDFKDKYPSFYILGANTDANAGVINITVTAEDHAGNTASKTVVLKIKGTEKTPNAKADYPNDALSWLAPNADYKITFGGKEYTKTADENGRIPFVLDGEEGGAGDMCGKTVQIVKLGTTENGVECTTDSAALSLTIARRPDAIEEEKIVVTPELAKDAENAIINLDIQGVAGTKEYSVDGGTTWTDVPSDNKIQNLKSGDVIVRIKATNSAPHGFSSEPKTIEEGSKFIHAAFNLNGDGATGQPAKLDDLTGKSTLTKPTDPSRQGYQFMGWYMESGCVNEWRFKDDTNPYQVKEWRKDDTQTTFDPETVGEELTITLYAKWRETTPPVLTPKLTTTNESGTVTVDGTNWYNNLTLTADYSDNVGVTKLSVRVDNGDYKELDRNNATQDGSNPAVYHYTYPVLEGSHTYRFKAEDAAGNVTETAAVTAKLDTVNPELGEADVSNGYHSFWDWIVKDERLQITVPVADKSAGSGIKMSGIKSVAYVLTPAGGSAQTPKSVNVSGGKAVIQIDPDFKGTVRITAYDNAGNTAEKIIGADGIKGVIVENNAPEVTILADREISDSSSKKEEDAGIEVSTAHYNSAPRLYVKVTDDTDAAITSGLKSVTWSVDRIDNGAEHQSGMNFESDTIKTEHSFTISALEGMDGTVNVTVKAEDQAGNVTTVRQTVNIKTKEPQPAPQIDYRQEILTNLVAGATYKVLGTDGNEKEITADGNGHIKMEEEWFGREVQICRAGDGTTTLDSVKTDVKPAARPAPPRTEAEESETVKAKADGIIAASAGSGLDLKTLEYSTDGGKSWNPITAEMLTDGKLSGCAAGAWLFRVPACDTAPYGETTEVIIGTGRTLTVSFVENGGSEVPEITDLSWHDAVKEPKDPVREGYEFMGWYQEAAFEHIWHFEGENPVTVMEGDITLYAKWRDNVYPALGAVLVSSRSSGNADEKQWYNNLSIALTYSDNTAVTDLYASVDGGNDARLDISGAAAAGKASDGSVLYRLDDNDLKEGEHTYIFKAVDEGGNVTTTKALTARLDTTNPVTGEAAYELGHKNLWDWIIRKESLLITVPVTDMGSDKKAGSGVDSVTYRLTPVGADGNGDESKATDGTAKIDKVSDGKFTATISVPADFKGTVKVTAADKAGNTAAEKTLGVAGGGIIVEDNAPKVSFMTGGLAITGDFYENAQDIEVTVDDAGEGITGGIASVQYEMTGEDGKTTSYKVEHDYTTSLAESDSFTVPANVFRPGVNTLTVTAADHAGNSASVPVTVKIKRPEPTPDPKIDYVAERLTGLVANAEYKIADVGMKADEKGSVAIDESWIGTEISVIRMPGTGENTVSAAKKLAVPDRPEAPAVTVENETYPGAGNGTLTMTETGKVYQFSPDGGSWTDAETDENRRITGLAAKEYYLRAKAIENTSFRSKEGTVTVGTTPPEPYDPPQTEIDYENEMLSNLEPDAEYIIEYGGDPDDEVVTVIIKADENGKIPVKPEWQGEKLSIVQKSNGKEKSDSPQQLLDIPVRPEAPNPSGEDETGIRTGAKLTNLTAGKAYDISRDDGKSWLRKKADGNGVISGVDAPATYIVRVAAEGGFKSPNSGRVTVDGCHIPVTFITDGVTTGTSWAYYGKAPQNIPAVPPKADAGDKTYVGEWCADVNGAPADLTNITAETTVYAYYTIGYNVILKGGTGYTLAAAPGSTSPVKEGADFTLQFSLGSGYEKTDGFAVKVNGVPVALQEDGTYTIENIKQDQTVTVEGIRKKPSSGGSDEPGHDSGGQTGGDNNPPADDNSPADDTPPADKAKPDGTIPGAEKPGGTEADNKKPGGADADDEKPGQTDADDKKPGQMDADGKKPGETDTDQTKPGGKFPHKEAPEGKTPGGSDLPKDIKLPDGTKLTGIIVPVTIEDGKLGLLPGTPDGGGDGTETDGTGGGSITDGDGGNGTADGTGGNGAGNGSTADGNAENGTGIGNGTGDGSGTDSAAAIPTGNVPGMEADGVILQTAGGGAVVVTVVCEEKTYTAGVADTIAVANAVLTPKQIELVDGGGTIEILIDVKDITDSVPLKDKEIIENGIETGRKNHPGLMLGMYIDISMFVKIGGGDWNAITHTEEPVDVVVGIPETLKAEGREFTIIRSHDATYALLPDLDDNPDTITISTDLFSAYAIAYEETSQVKGNAKCGLCHICPTFLGICYFIWIAAIVAAVLLIWILIRKKKEEKEKEAVK